MLKIQGWALPTLLKTLPFCCHPRKAKPFVRAIAAAITLNLEHLCYGWVDRVTIEGLRPILITQFLEGLDRVDATH